MADEQGRWVTINGTHVFIKRGETIDDAIARLNGKSDEPYFTLIQKYPLSKVIRMDDLESYELEGWKQANYQPDFDEAIRFVDSIDVTARQGNWILAQLQRYKNTPIYSFLRGRLEERIATHQQKLADEFLRDCKKYTGEQMPESLAVETNPHYEESHELLASGSHDTKAAEYTMNCQRCVQAFVLQWCHGYDVQAKPCQRFWSDKSKKFLRGDRDQNLKWYVDDNDYGTMVNGDPSWYTNWQCAIFNAADVRKTHVDATYIQNEVGYAGVEDQYRWIKRTVKQAGPGACYIAAVSWKGTLDENGFYEAHVFCIINDGGKVKCIDPQTGRECSEYFTQKQIKSNRTEIFRADTCRLNGAMMNEVIEKRGD